VWNALGTVHDPELDRAITELGFVTEASVREDAASGCTVLVRLRLPTYFCAPNFAYLMVADAHEAVGAIPGVQKAEVRLEDHFAADEINSGVAAQAGFARSFPRHAKREPAELRLIFRRKGYLAAQGRLGKRLTELGWTTRQMAEARLRDLSDRLTAPLVRRRRALGLPTGGDEPVFTDEHGRRVLPGDMETHLKRGRTTAVGIGVNTEMCGGLLATRYGTPEAGRESVPESGSRPTAETSVTSRTGGPADRTPASTAGGAA
jgi:metal-sulfur cluster biosynthetic enzyme